jgi:hypothetical protein
LCNVRSGDGRMAEQWHDGGSVGLVGSVGEINESIMRNAPFSLDDR